MTVLSNSQKLLLEKHTGYVSLLNSKLDKLPKTEILLDEIIENKIDYLIRKVKWVASEFRQKNLNYGKWDLINKACVYKYHKEEPLQKAIYEELKQLEKKR